MANNNDNNSNIDKKLLNNAYKEGYGQARSDLMVFIKEALADIHDALTIAKEWNASEERIKALQMRKDELQRLRAYVKVMKAKR